MKRFICVKPSEVTERILRMNEVIWKGRVHMHISPPTVHTMKTKADKVWDGIALVLLAASILYSIVQWNVLPNQVPAHFNGAGEVDRYGSKWMLLLLPLIGMGMFGILDFLERHPQWHNYPQRLNERNARQFYQNSRILLNRVKNISVVLFAYIQLEVVWVALQKRTELSMWIVGGLIGVMLFIIVVIAIRQSKVK